MNTTQIELLRILYNSGVQNTQKLAQACKLENSTAAYHLCGLRDLGYVVSDTKNQRGGGFATWSVTVSGHYFMYGHSFMYERKAAPISPFIVPYGSVAPSLSAEQVINKHLDASLAALRADFTQLSDKLRTEKAINGELNGLVQSLRAKEVEYAGAITELRTKLREATAVKPVSGRHYFAVISQLQGSYTSKVVERFAREADALRTAETYAQTHNTETVSVCESKHIIQLEQVLNVKAVAKPI